MVWTSPRAIFLLTVLTEHSAQNHDCSILVYLPSWQHLSFVHVEELKLAIGFQLHSHLYTSKLTSDLVTCKIWSNFFSMNFTASIRGLFAIGLLGTLCGGAFYTSCECYLSWTEIVSNWGEGAGCGHSFEGSPLWSGLSDWSCNILNVLSVFKHYEIRMFLFESYLINFSFLCFFFPWSGHDFFLFFPHWFCYHSVMPQGNASHFHLLFREVSNTVKHKMKEWRCLRCEWDETATSWAVHFLVPGFSELVVCVRAVFCR